MQNTASSAGLQEKFMAAWNAHDLETVLSMITDDCDFVTSDSRAFKGRDVLRGVFAAVFDRFPDAHWEASAHFRVGDRGVSEWVFTGTDRTGVTTRAKGVDVLTFRGDLISAKDAYRKTSPSAATS